MSRNLIVTDWLKWKMVTECTVHSHGSRCWGSRSKLNTQSPCSHWSCILGAGGTENKAITYQVVWSSRKKIKAGQGGNVILKRETKKSFLTNTCWKCRRPLCGFQSWEMGSQLYRVPFSGVWSADIVPKKLVYSSREWTWCMLSHLSRIWFFATLWTVACLAPLCMGFCRQEYWSGLPGPPPGDLPDPGMEPGSHVSCTGRPVLY